MVLRLQNLKLEIRVLKTLTSNNESLQSMCFSRIRDESFDSAETQEAFARIKAYAKLGSIPSWNNFIHDTKLTEDTFNLLSNQKVTEARDRIDANIILGELDEFRQRREVYAMCEDVFTGLSRGGEIQELMNDATERLSRARIANTSETDMFSIGSGAGPKVFKKIFKNLKGDGIEKIPTGIETYDKVNGGVPIGSCFVIGAPSGEGKSAFALNIAINMASSGANVCFGSFEMNESQTTSRYLGALTAIPVIKIENQALTPAEEEKIDRAIAIHDASLRMTGGKFTIKVPTSDLTIEEFLFGLKPFGFKVIVIDYLTLLRGMTGERAWEAIGEGVRLCKRIAELYRCVVIPVVQTDDDGDPRFSKMIKDNASLMWTWGKVKSKDGDGKKTTRDQVETFDVAMGKTRNQVPVPLKIFRKFSVMQMTDNPRAINQPWIETVPYYDELEKLTIKELENYGEKRPDQKLLDFIYVRKPFIVKAAKTMGRVPSNRSYVNHANSLRQRRNVINKNADPRKYLTLTKVKPATGGFSAKSGAIVLRGGIASSHR